MKIIKKVPVDRVLGQVTCTICQSVMEIMTSDLCASDYFVGFDCPVCETLIETNLASAAEVKVVKEMLQRKRTQSESEAK